jgi:hypothetical protein
MQGKDSTTKPPLLPKDYIHVWARRGEQGMARRLWGTDIPQVHQKDKMPHEGPVGPIIRKVIPSWAWGGTSNKPDRRKPRRPEEFKRRSQ